MVDPPSQFVIFGATGDLALRKLLPALASLAAKGQPAAGFHLVGVSRADLDDAAYRQFVLEAMPPELSRVASLPGVASWPPPRARAWPPPAWPSRSHGTTR